MKKIGRIATSSLLILFGLAAGLFGVVLLLQSHDLITAGFGVVLSIFGVTVLLGGWAVARGDGIKDILESLFLGFP